MMMKNPRAPNVICHKIFCKFLNVYEVKQIFTEFYPTENYGKFYSDTHSIKCIRTPHTLQ